MNRPPFDTSVVWPSSAGGAPDAATVRVEPVPRRTIASAGFLLDAMRRRRSGRIFLWFVVVSLALAGTGLLSYPLVTDVWAGRIQNRLEKQFTQLTATTPQGFESLPSSQQLTRLRISKLDVDVIVVEGTSGNALRAGAGHFPETALPGEPTGNFAVAGHRTGFGQPFRNLHKMRTGDTIEVVTPYGKYVYEVIGDFDGHKNPWVSNPYDRSPIAPTADPTLTLMTCDPPHTSKNRMWLRARLAESLPR